MVPAPIRLSMRGVAKSFGATQALAGVDLEVEAGALHALLGENGAGKSTLMKVLSGALAPDAGAIELEGRPFAPRSPREASRAGVRMVHQELALCPGLSVAENLLLGEEPARGPPRARHSPRSDARSSTSTRASRACRSPSASWSRSRALRGDARVLVLDEPTSSLPREEVAQLFALLRSLAARGVSVLYISHAIEEVRELCTHWTVLRDGRSVGSGRVAESDERRWIALMAGREVRELYPRSERTRGEVVLRVAGARGRRLPRAADLELHRGEVLGLYGLIGAGRTELLRGIFGLDPLQARELALLGRSGVESPRARWRGGAGFVSEDRKREGLALDLSIAENLSLARLEQFARRGLLDARAQHAAAVTWTSMLGVKLASVEQRCGELSGGNQQKVALARLLCAGSQVLLLDEPTRGIDVGSKAQIYAWIDQLARGEKGRSARGVLLVSSYIPELLGVCDRIAVMRDGVLGPARPAAECSEESLLAEALLDSRADEVSP